jgi:hypothetical protein
MAAAAPRTQGLTSAGAAGATNTSNPGNGQQNTGSGKSTLEEAGGSNENDEKNER